LPDSLVGIFNTYHGIHGADMVALLTQTEYNGEGKTLLIFFSIGWILLAFALSFTAYVLIPFFLKSSQPSHDDQLLQRKNSLKSYLFVSVTVLIFFIGSVITRKQNTHRYRPIQAVMYINMVLNIFMLVFILKENDEKMAVKQYLFGLFKISESFSSREPERSIPNSGESLAHFSGKESSKGMETLPKCKSIYITVVPAMVPCVEDSSKVSTEVCMM